MRSRTVAVQGAAWVIAAAITLGAAITTGTARPAQAQPVSLQAQTQTPSDSLLPGCTSCHALAHGLPPSAEPSPGAWSPVCAGCHAAAHVAQQQMYAGRGAVGVAPLSSPMFAARVACVACHGGGRAGARPVGVLAEEADCVACHGIEFRGILPRWRTEGARRLAEVGRYVASADRLRGARRSGAADSLLNAARANVELVREGRGVHNVRYADAVLRASVRQAQAALRAAGATPPPLPRLGPDRADELCTDCHFGVERVAAEAYGVTFPHDTHLVAAGVRCDRCHVAAGFFAPDGRTRDPAHGRSTLAGVDGCRGCHHAGGAETCVGCHALAEIRDVRLSPRVPVRVSVRQQDTVRELPFQHQPHDVFPCATCHTAGLDRAAQSNCRDCHDIHHQARSTCTACHDAPQRAVHPVNIVHTGCTGCHAPEAVAGITAVRNVCLVCHTDRVEHNPGRECAGCHQVRFSATAASRFQESPWAAPPRRSEDAW